MLETNKLQKPSQDQALDKLVQIQNCLNSLIIGQEQLIQDLLIAMITQGHVLLEGPPGVAKTTSVSLLAKATNMSFQRIQFTPDLLPSDLTGSEIYRHETHSFEFIHGPIFAQIVLADEINRAPAKVQSALLEAMSEKQVSVGQTSYQLPEPFVVLATQNPIEQEGTYSLPEAQLDRFLFKLKIDFPTFQNEKLILKSVANFTKLDIREPLADFQDFQTIQQAAKDIHLTEPILDYIANLVLATRLKAQQPGEIASNIEYGASTRASICLYQASKVLALMQGRSFVIPEDVQNLFFPVMRHRIGLSMEAQAEGVQAEEVLGKILQTTPIV